MLTTALGRFRITGLLEGISYLLLLGIAMPLKYLADISMAVTIAGAVHGVLFILYLLTLAHVFFTDKWKFSHGLFAFLASIIPFGTFYLDAKLKKNEKPMAVN
jgi:integral membrane protein